MQKMQNFVLHPDGARLPLSKGILSQQIATVGVSLDQAYEIAQKIQDTLRSNKQAEIEFTDLSKMVGQVLVEENVPEIADRWEKWGRFRASGVPIIMLITGGNGTGKSTLATQLSLRLGINRLTSTDSIREVMRELSVESLVPQLYQSSYRVTPPPGARDDDPIAGYIQQAHAVNIGIQAILKRAAKERTSMIVEGIHLLPSISAHTTFKGCAVIPITLIVPDQRDHYLRFQSREVETLGERRSDEYVPYFKAIRAIHEHLVTEALAHDHMLIDTAQLESSMPALLDLVIAKADEITQSLKK